LAQIVGTALEKASEVSAQIIDHGDDNVDGNQQGEELVFEEEADRNVDLLAQASCPDQTQYRCRPDVHLPPVKSIGDKVGVGLWKKAIQDERRAFRTLCLGWSLAN
jgi:hypothetical protein